MAYKRRQRDADADKALRAEVFKLLGNSAYGKFIEAVGRQTRLVYTTDEDTVDKHLRSAWFEDLGGGYKIVLRKNNFTINRPFQIGIVVYQLAKLHMLQFYYDFLDCYVDRRDFELILMDTDSLYFVLSHDMMEEAVRPELVKEFNAEKNLWLSWNKWSSHEPGLFNLESEGARAIALCSKRYFVENEDSGKAKVSSKGMSKTQNALTWRRFEEALAGVKDMATTEASGCETAPCTLTNKYSWASARTMTSAGLGVGGWHPHRAHRIPS